VPEADVRRQTLDQISLMTVSRVNLTSSLPLIYRSSGLSRSSIMESVALGP